MLFEVLNNKNIAIIIPDFDFGGEEKRVLYFANNYLNYFNKVYLFCPRGKSLNFLDPNVIHFEFNVRNFLNIGKFLSLVKSLQIDFVQGHKRATLPYLKASELNSNVICNFNFDNIYHRNKVFKYITPKYLFYLSDYMKAFYENIYPNRFNIAINMGGDFFKVLTPSVKKTLKNELSIPKDKIVLLCLGRLSKQKNQEQLIRVLHSIQDPRYICLFAGDGPDLPSLRKLSILYNLENQVRFLGHRTDIENILNIADILVQCSLFEGFPNVFIEAASIGLPIIASNVGSSKSIVLKNGILFKPNNDDELSLALQRMANEYEKYKTSATTFMNSDFLKGFHKNEMLLNYLRTYEYLCR